MPVFWQKRKQKAIITDADNDTAVWEGKIGKKTYKAQNIQERREKAV